VYLGRCSPDKGLDLAIRAAQAAGVPLRVGAKLDAVDRDWFDSVVVPLARRGGVEFVGEVLAADKCRFLADAAGLLHPSRWSEPFGLAAVEAMACGTPVVMLRRGAADEIVADGIAGFVVTEEDDLPAAVERLPEIDRAACRDRAKALFDRRGMADGYESLFEEGVRW
jgi:glycosyltransferase involved in cell wall biosynthesis